MYSYNRDEMPEDAALVVMDENKNLCKVYTIDPRDPTISNDLKACFANLEYQKKLIPASVEYIFIKQQDCDVEDHYKVNICCNHSAPCAQHKPVKEELDNLK